MQPCFSAHEFFCNPSCEPCVCNRQGGCAPLTPVFLSRASLLQSSLCKTHHASILLAAGGGGGGLRPRLLQPCKLASERVQGFLCSQYITLRLSLCSAFNSGMFKTLGGSTLSWLSASISRCRKYGTLSKSRTRCATRLQGASAHWRATRGSTSFRKSGLWKPRGCRPSWGGAHRSHPSVQYYQSGSDTLEGK